MGANRLAQGCADLEAAAYAGNDPAILAQQSSAIAATLEATLGAIRSYLEGRKGPAPPVATESASTAGADMSHLAPQHKLLQMELAEAIERGEFTLNYQPLVDRTGARTLARGSARTLEPRTAQSDVAGAVHSDC